MPEKLGPEDLQQSMQSVPEWSINERGELTRVIGFDSYKDGLVFATTVGFLADRMDHHPDLLIGYQRVTVSVSTHSAGGLTKLDFDLARKVDALIA